MKYKLLNQRGMHIVCLEDGTKIPVQVSAMTQIQREKCVVTVEALCDKRIGTEEDVKLNFSEGVLTYGKYTLDNAQVLSYKKGTGGPGYEQDKWELGRITFVVDCELPDTNEQPKPYKA